MIKSNAGGGRREAMRFRIVHPTSGKKKTYPKMTRCNDRGGGKVVTPGEEKEAALSRKTVSVAMGTYQKKKKGHRV